MAKKNKRIVPLLLVSAFAVIGVVGTTVSCGGGNGGGGEQVSENQTCAITWKIDEHARVTEGKVDSITAGEKITFKVEVDAHYEIVAVKAGTSRKSGKDGVYSFAVNADVEISITVQKIVSGVEVTTKPTKLTYIAGEDIDTTGMVVNLKYEDGTSETIDNSKLAVYTGDAATTSFNGGETSFFVEYGDYKIKVELDKIVEYAVTIDPAGATVAPSYYEKLAALGLNNYVKNGDGSVSFTYYGNLPSEGIAVPGADEMEYVDHAFKQWSGATVIKNSTGTVSTVASWQAQLVAITECKMAVEDNVPYLIVTGTFKAAEKVSLFLHEGNKSIDLNGPEYTGTRDSAFNVKFDLRELANKAQEDDSYFGAWMDIKFVAEDENGKETMEIFVTDPSITVNEDQKVLADGYSYSFANWNGALKVFVTAAETTYTASFEEVDGTSYLVLKGLATQYAGKSIYISWWNGSQETDPDVAPIGTDGSFELRIATSKFNADSMAYAHGGIVEDVDGTYTFITGGTNTNFTGTGMLNEVSKLDKKAGDISSGVRFESSDGYAYYVGSPWGGLTAYFRNEAQSVDLTSAKLVEEGGVVYYVAEGEIKGYTEAKFDFDFQHNSNIDNQGWAAVVSSRIFSDFSDEANLAEQITGIISGNKVTVKIPVSTLIAKDGLTADGWTFSVHLGIAGAAKDFKPSDVDLDTKIVVDGVEYSLRQDSNTWSMAALVMKAVTA